MMQNRAASKLHLPLPEICFGNNRLSVESEKMGLSLEWDTLAALKVVKEESGVKVAHAAEWARGLVTIYQSISLSEC